MYSAEWFETYAATVPPEITEADVEGIAAQLPTDRFPRLLDVGCGIGRIAGPLFARGYSVTGIDVSCEALRAAARRAPGPRYVALDQRHVNRLRWTFDGVLFLWNSLGFVGRSTDLETLHGVATVLRPGGKAVFDLYHPGWLEKNPRSGGRDERGAASVERWLRDGRLFHEFRYPNGRIDDIQFDVYQPNEIRDVCLRAGLQPEIELVRWTPDRVPNADQPRYQLIAARPE